MIRARAPWLLLAAAVVLSACAPQDAATADQAEVAEKTKQAAEKKMEYMKGAEKPPTSPRTMPRMEPVSRPCSRLTA